MDLVILISLINAGTLAIALMGALMFFMTPSYRGLCLLLALVSLAALTNLLEDLQISRELHLISPVFVLGYGPALYFAVKRLINGPIDHRVAWHFLPMLLVLPFTVHPQSVIAAGTILRMFYALLTLQLIIKFNRQLATQRSDAAEVSLAWLGGLIGISTLFGTFDLLRLNFQPELGAERNMIGYALHSFISFNILLLLILILNSRRSGLETLTGSTLDDSFLTHRQSQNNEESAADYQSLFTSLDKELREQNWYCMPRLTLNQLSDLTGMTTRDISRCINLVSGMSFNDYINQHRIEKIKQALQVNDTKNLIDLAFAAGFSSKATFNQSFKKSTGMTPRDFRNKQYVQHQDS